MPKRKHITELRVFYTKTNIHFWSYFAQFFLKLGIFQAKWVEKIKTHFLFSVTVFRDRAVYEKRRKNTVGPDRSQMTLWRMRIVCWIHKSKNTHLDCVILIAFPLKQWLHGQTSMLHYTCLACLVQIWIYILHGRHVKKYSNFFRTVVALGKHLPLFKVMKPSIVMCAVLMFSIVFFISSLK